MKIEVEQPIIDKLLDRLPPFDPAWDEEKRQAWLDAFFKILEFVSEPPRMIELKHPPEIDLSNETWNGATSRLIDYFRKAQNDVIGDPPSY